VLAHASIVTPDAGLMLGCLASLYLFWRWSECRTWRWAMLLGVVLGLTQAAKYTAVLVYPVLGCVWIGLALTSRRRAIQVSPAKGSGWQFPAAVAVSLIVLNAVYLFHGTGRQLGDYAFTSQSLTVASAALGALHWLPVPLPQDYLEGLDAQRAIMESPHPVFLDGQWSITGFPGYYFKTLEYKLPHPLQLAVLVGLLSTLLFRSARIPFRVHCLIGLMFAGLLGTAAGTAMQLGVRYILPLLPLGMLYAGAVFRVIDSAPRAFRIAVLVVATIACGASLRHHPHHLAYFNEYAGGPVGGREHLVDSNIDWGQDLNLVREFMYEHDLPTIGLAYFGTLHPQDLGINYTVPPMLTAATAPTFRLPPGWYAVSVNFVMGRPHLVHTPDGRDPPVDINAFGYFRELEPVARLGYSIDVYRVE
jgi:4-amino-4-deoxy-L-arabinose transferase-like glycosyltransferase